LASALKDAGLEMRPIELFFFPVPSVKDLWPAPGLADTQLS